MAIFEEEPDELEEDPGLEAPPAPWEYDDGGDDGSDSSSDSQGAGYAEMRDQYNDAGIGAGGTGQADSGDAAGYDQGAGYAEMRDQYNEAGIGAGGSAVGDYGQGEGYAEMRDQYNEAGMGAGGSAADDYSQGKGWNAMRDQYNAAGIGAGGSAPSGISQGEGWNLMRDQYNAAGIGAGGSAARDTSQGEGWKIMRDQYDKAGLGAGGTPPGPQNRWEAATLPNLLAWGAGYRNAMGQTPQQMVEWANRSIQQWNSAHPDDQFPLLPPVVGPKMPELPRAVEGPKIPAQLLDKKFAQMDTPVYDPKSGRWIQPDSTVPDASDDRYLDYSKYDKTLDYMYDEMIRNVNSRQAKNIQSMLDLTVHPYLTGGDPALYFTAAMSEWASMVATGREWDHKPKLDSMLGLREAKDYYFPIRGDTEHKYYYNIWSNIHYGYVGSAAGFDAETLHRGGDSIIPFTPYDYDPTSAISIQIGIDLWNQKGTKLRPEDIQLAILAHKQDYMRYSHDPKFETVVPIKKGR